VTVTIGNGPTVRLWQHCSLGLQESGGWDLQQRRWLVGYRRWRVLVTGDDGSWDNIGGFFLSFEAGVY
jgi:hypothetical protein